MQRCIDLANNGLGHTYPNPLVGSVIVCNNKIIGEGYHTKSGENHAEVNAINSVKDKSLLEKSTIYVSLEPCSHFGKTPPCADFIIKNKIPKVVIGTIDTFSEVCGRGIKKLKDAGCDVTIGVLENECKEINKRFFTFHQKKRPYVIIKWAQSFDGFISITRQKYSKPQPYWISNETSKILSHKWRSEEQAIIVGKNTAFSDNPKLDVRDWAGQSPLRIVIDKKLELNKNLHLLDDTVKTLVFNNFENKFSKSLMTEYCKIDFSSDIISQILNVLYQKQIQSLIVEGGTFLINSFYNSGFWDEIYVTFGKIILNSGISAPKIQGKLISNQKIDTNILFNYKNII